jgi:hypothetical protein
LHTKASLKPPSSPQVSTFPAFLAIPIFSVVCRIDLYPPSSIDDNRCLTVTCNPFLARLLTFPSMLFRFNMGTDYLTSLSSNGCCNQWSLFRGWNDARSRVRLPCHDRWKQAECMDEYERGPNLLAWMHWRLRFLSGYSRRYILVHLGHYLS